MDLPAVPLDAWQSFLVCLVRILAVVGSMPVFGTGQGPVRLRVGLAFMLAVLMFPVVEPHLPGGGLSFLALGVILLQETVFGVIMGFTARLILMSIQFGGTVVGYKMGFAKANVMDHSQQQVPLMGQFMNVVAVLVFLSVDGHHVFIRGLAKSYEILPPGTADFSGEAIPYVMSMTGDMFVLGLQLISPMLIVLTLNYFGLGIMARLMPQMNVLMLSWPVNQALGFVFLGLSLNMIVFLLGEEFQALGERFMQLLQMM